MALWGTHDFKTITDGAGNDSEVTAVSGNKITVTTIAKDEPYELKVGDYVNLVGLNSEIIPIEVGKVIKDSKIGWFEGVVNKELGFK